MEADAVLRELLDSSWARAGRGARSAWPEMERMAPNELLEFLAQERFCAIASSSPRGDPQLVPGSFVCLPDGAFWLPTVAGAARLLAVRSRPRLALMVGQTLGSRHQLVLARGPARELSPAALSPAVLEQARAKLGELSWASSWLRLRPTWMIGYSARPGSPSRKG